MNQSKKTRDKADTKRGKSHTIKKTFMMKR